jgi:pyridoxine 4-dehydrogenase
LTWPQDPVPDEQAFKVLKAALAAGVHVWTGADFYGTPANNSLHLMHHYFTAFPEDANKVVLCIKSGVVDMRTFQMDGSPDGMRRSVDNANAILASRKAIDLFGCGRVDANVPIEETVSGLAALKAEGKIGGIQLSEVSAPTIRRTVAAAAATNSTVIDMVEAEVSLWATDIFTNGVAATCADLNITVVAHTPLGAGMLTDQIRSLDDMPAHDHHRHFPRFQPEDFSQNLKLVDEANRLAMSKGCTTAQLALSWLSAGSRLMRRSHLACRSLCQSLELDRRRECGRMSWMWI